MNEIIKAQQDGGKESFTSLELVDLINQFREQEGNKNPLLHKNFMVVIRDEFEEEINEGNISAVEYQDKKGESRPMFELTLKQARQVLVRESKFVRRAVIDYIDKLENEISVTRVPTDYSTALRALADEWDKNQKLMLENKVQHQQIQEMKPKVSYYDIVLQSTDVTTVTQISKDYGMSAKQFNQVLHDNKVQFKQSGTWLLYQKYVDKGYTQTKTQAYSKKDGTQGTIVHTYWTQKGRLFLYDLLKQSGVLPLIEQEQDIESRKES